MVHRLDVDCGEGILFFLGDAYPVRDFGNISCRQSHIEVEVQFILAPCVGVLQSGELFASR